jgi:YHS domain-containing protein
MRQIFILLLLGGSFQVLAQNAVERTKHFNVENGLAIQGYDPISYFTKNKSEKGDPKIFTRYAGITYYFASTGNKEMFLRNPMQYEPQYGGWCAFAMGDYGKKVEINPETFKIIEGKLYLFYNAYLTNTLNSWNKNEKTLKVQADKNWAILTKK